MSRLNCSSGSRYVRGYQCLSEQGNGADSGGASAIHAKADRLLVRAELPICKLHFIPNTNNEKMGRSIEITPLRLAVRLVEQLSSADLAFTEACSHARRSLSCSAYNGTA
jgi:hypothetical protein